VDLARPTPRETVGYVRDILRLFLKTEGINPSTAAERIKRCYLANLNTAAIESKIGKTAGSRY
jgi:hypothetical protein